MKQTKKEEYAVRETTGAALEPEQETATHFAAAEPENTNGKANKKPYIAPEIRVTYIQLEQGIAAGSATVKPANATGQVKDEWDDQGSKGSTYNW